MRMKIAAALMAFAVMVVAVASCSPTDEEKENGNDEAEMVAAVAMKRMTISAATLNFAIKPDGSLWAWGLRAPLMHPGIVLEVNGLPSPVCIMENTIAVSNSG